MPKYKNFTKGFTLVEIAVCVAILMSIIVGVVLIIKPNEYKKKARDTKRVSQILQLYEAISEYKLKNGTFPGTLNKLYNSDFAYASPVNSADFGWIEENLTGFVQNQYVDPINSGIYVYQYIHNSTDFELNAVLEIKLDTMQNDKGNNSSKFEVGTDLDLLN